MRNKDNLKYLLYALVFLLFFYAEKRLGISPFAIGLFMAAVYSKQNILFLAPIYIICGICVSPTLTQLAYLAAPVFIVTWFSHSLQAQKGGGAAGNKPLYFCFADS